MKGNGKAAVAAPKARSQTAAEPKTEIPKPARRREPKAEPRSERARPPTEAAARRLCHAARPDTKPLASPAVRQRARELGIELQFVPGTGPAGRITHADLDAYIASGGKGDRPRAAAPTPGATAAKTSR